MCRMDTLTYRFTKSASDFKSEWKQKKFLEGNIENILNNFTSFSENNGNRPTIVIDLMGLVNVLSKDKVEMLCGGRHPVYRFMLEDLLRKMKSVADLVFFEDGPVVNEKLDTWVKRQNEKYVMSINVIEKIYNRIPLRKIASDPWNLPTVTSYLQMIEESAQRFGKLIVTVTKECDAEIARYANQNPSVIAVMADDTDFLIFPGRWRYWSLNQIDLQTMMTKEYNKLVLRNFLGLNDQQLVVLSTLGGNDIIQYDEVRRFHHHHCGHKVEQKFLWLAEYIKCYLMMPLHSHSMVNTIAQEILQDDRQITKKRIRGSFKQYGTNFVEPSIVDSLLIFCRQNYYDFTYSILRQMPKNMTLMYYDLRCAPDIFQITKEFFCKQIGIVLQHQPSLPSGINFEICTKRFHEEPYRQFYVSPNYPEMKLPPLIELLNRKVHAEHDSIRFDLLKWMIDETKLQSHDLTAIPTNYFLDILVLTYMTTHGFIETDEADLILLTIKHVELDMIPENLQAPDIVDERAFRISFLFNKCHTNVARALEITGLKESMTKLINFDGVLFHNLFLKFKQSGLKPAMLLADLEPYRFYK